MILQVACCFNIAAPLKYVIPSKMTVCFDLRGLDICCAFRMSDYTFARDLLIFSAIVQEQLF